MAKKREKLFQTSAQFKHSQTHRRGIISYIPTPNERWIKILNYLHQDEIIKKAFPLISSLESVCLEIKIIDLRQKILNKIPIMLSKEVKQYYLDFVDKNASGLSDSKSKIHKARLVINQKQLNIKQKLNRGVGCGRRIILGNQSLLSEDENKEFTAEKITRQFHKLGLHLLRKTTCKQYLEKRAIQMNQIYAIQNQKRNIKVLN